MIRRSALFMWLLCLLATTAGAATKSWTGAVNNLWSVGGNWNDGLPPVDNDSLVFPDGAANRDTVNDLIGLDIVSISIEPASLPAYSFSGNPISLSGGLTTTCCSTPNIWSIPTLLTASQLFSGSGALDLAAVIGLNGHTLTISSPVTTLSGSLIGSGELVVTNTGLNLTGTSSFFGNLVLSSGGINVDGTISNSTLSGNHGVSGSGVIPDTNLSSSTLLPGSNPGAFCCADPHTTAILSSDSIWLTDSTLGIDLDGPIPGSNYDQLAVSGVLTLDNTALQVSLPGTLPAAGQTFVIISNATQVVSGTFNGLPEGALFTSSGVSFRITYTGNDGNDVVLTAIASTATTLMSSENPTVSGETFTLTATVSSLSPGTPTGSVRFLDGATVLGTSTLDPAGAATLITALPAGTHSIVAEYLGDPTFAPSSSAPLTQVVTEAIPTFSTSGLILLGFALAAAGIAALRS